MFDFTPVGGAVLALAGFGVYMALAGLAPGATAAQQRSAAAAVPGSAIGDYIMEVRAVEGEL